MRLSVGGELISIYHLYNDNPRGTGWYWYCGQTHRDRKRGMAHSQLGPETDGILSEFSRIKLGKGGWGVLLMAGNESGVDLSLHHMKALNTKAMASLALAATCFGLLFICDKPSIWYYFCACCRSPHRQLGSSSLVSTFSRRWAAAPQACLATRRLRVRGQSGRTSPIGLLVAKLPREAQFRDGQYDLLNVLAMELEQPESRLGQAFREVCISDVGCFQVQRASSLAGWWTCT